MPAIWQNNTTIRQWWVKKSRSFLWMMPARTELGWTAQLTAAWCASVSGQALGRAHCDSPNKWPERFYYPDPARSETRSEPPQDESLWTTPYPASPSPPPRSRDGGLAQNNDVYTGWETDSGTDTCVTLTCKPPTELSQSSKRQPLHLGIREQC